MRAKRCDDVLQYAGGELRFYTKNLRVVAYCPWHLQCVRTRSVRRPPPTGKKQRGQGRPLGFLAAWLELGATLDADQHNSLQPNGVDIEQRLAARSRLNATLGPSGFSAESGRRDQTRTWSPKCFLRIYVHM